MRDGAGKYGAAGMEGKNGGECHGAAVSEWLMENNGWQFLVAVLSGGGSTDAGDRILMRAVQDATREMGQRLSASNKRRRCFGRLCLPVW